MDIYGSNGRSQKECLSSTEKNLEHQGGQIETALEVFTERSRYQQTQVRHYSNRILVLSRNKIDIFKRTKVILEFIQRCQRINYKKMEEQFYQLIEEKEEFPQFEIDSDEGILQLSDGQSLLLSLI